jgi:hypothetical protein
VGVSQSVNGGVLASAGAGNYLNTSPVNLTSGTVGVSLSYDGVGTVSETLTQGASIFSTSYSVQGYQTVLGGNNSFLAGFTGATGGLNAGLQISQFQFTPVGSQLPKIRTIFHPGDVIAGTQTSGGTANSPSGEPAPFSIDNAAQSKYLNFNAGGSGIYETPALGLSIANTLSLTSANDAPERDPATYEVWGTNDPNPNDTNPVLNPGWASFYTLISSGTVPAFAGRFTEASIPFANSTPYTSYVVDFPTVANPTAANSMQIADIQLSGPIGVPEPGTAALFTIGALMLLSRGWIGAASARFLRR